MTEEATGELATRAAQLAMSAAVRFAIANGKNPLSVAPESHWCDEIRAAVKNEFPTAMKDAGDAIAAGMGDVASETFAASMRLAGIKAARKVLGLPVKAV